MLVFSQDALSISIVTIATVSHEHEHEHERRKFDGASPRDSAYDQHQHQLLKQSVLACKS